MHHEPVDPKAKNPRWEKLTWMTTRIGRNSPGTGKTPPSIQYYQSAHPLSILPLQPSIAQSIFLRIAGGSLTCHPWPLAKPGMPVTPGSAYMDGLGRLPGFPRFLGLSRPKV